MKLVFRLHKTSAQLADEIGVQASGISHILSGRNNPSLDFVLKMLEKYQFLSTDWLLFGTGSMYKDSKMQSLFDDDTENNRDSNEIRTKREEISSAIDYQNVIKRSPEKVSADATPDSTSEVIKIVWFYENNRFEEFLPGK